jgi:hypothetical protein
LKKSVLLTMLLLGAASQGQPGVAATINHRVLAGQGRATSLREAMRELRLAQPHPHDWAPFIAVGSDAPLRARVPIREARPSAR